MRLVPALLLLACASRVGRLGGFLFGLISNRWLLAMILAAACGAPPALAALNYNSRSISGLSKAYGFVLGQEYSLARVESTFPALRIQVEVARLAFGSGFPNIKQGLEKELSNALGDTKLKQLQADITKKLKGLLSKQTTTLESSQQFLDLVRARGKGREIESDVLSYLLAVKYAHNPAGEFLDGFRQRYRTDGVGKSQGVKLVLQLPYSWRGKEAERPHIVQTWVSEGGTGLSNMMLSVQDAQGYASTRRELDQFVKSGEIREAVPDGAKYLDGGAFSQEKSAGYWMEMTMPQERAGIKMYMRGFMYLLFFRGKGISVMCMAGGPEQNRALADVESVKLKPLCQQVMNSLVLEQAY